MNAWSHLPNSHHIDWMFDSLISSEKLWIANENPYVFWGHLNMERKSTRRMLNNAWEMGSEMLTKNKPLNKTHEEIWKHAVEHTPSVKGSALVSVSCILVGLCVFDDCEKFLDIEHSKLLLYAMMTENIQATLLLPMVYIKEKTKCNNYH